MIANARDSSAKSEMIKRDIIRYRLKCSTCNDGNGSKWKLSMILCGALENEMRWSAKSNWTFD